MASELNDKPQNASILQPFDIGVVAFPKATDSNDIQVKLSGTTSYMSGEVAVNPQVLESKTSDGNGGTTSESVVTDSTIKATWIPKGSNMRTAPDVMVGERVEIYRFGDQDKYFWKEIGLDDHLRRLETKVFAISGTPEVGENETISDESWYFVELSSHKKHLMISNSKGNGEAVQYVCNFNFGEGKFSIADDLDNSIVVDSVERILQMINGDGTLIKIDKMNIEMIAQENIMITAMETITVLCKNLKISVTELIQMISQTNKQTADTWSVEANTASISAPGGIKLNGPLTHTGGDATSTGNFTTTQDIRAGGISLRNHRHGGVQTGGGFTSAPS